jgi:hypothetical protein
LGVVHHQAARMANRQAFEKLSALILFIDGPDTRF